MESQPLRKRTNKGNITDRSIWPCSAVKATFHRSPSTLKMLRETKATLRMRQVRERLYSARRFTGSSCIIQAEWQLPQFASKFPVADTELDRRLCLSVTWYVSDTLVEKCQKAHIWCCRCVCVWVGVSMLACLIAWVCEYVCMCASVLVCMNVCKYPYILFSTTWTSVVGWH